MNLENLCTSISMPTGCSERRRGSVRKQLVWNRWKLRTSKDKRCTECVGRSRGCEYWRIIYRQRLQWIEHSYIRSAAQYNIVQWSTVHYGTVQRCPDVLTTLTGVDEVRHPWRSSTLSQQLQLHLGCEWCEVISGMWEEWDTAWLYDFTSTVDKSIT